MKIYISGKISGLPYMECFAKFEAMEYKIQAIGHKPVNPMKNGLSPNRAWWMHMIVDIWMLLRCDIVLLLPDWQDSRGARVEERIARVFQKRIIY